MKRTPLTRKTPLVAGTLRGLTNADLPPGVTFRKLKATTIKASGKRKASRPKMTPARKAAKGQPCMVRLPGCDGGGETTVLAHYRLTGYCGTGIKPPDEMGAWACVRCHDACDGRRNCGLPQVEIRLAHAEGVMRTQVALKGERL